MSRRSILVTGSGGFIGSALVPALLKLGYDVAAVDRDSRRLDQLKLHSGAHNLRLFDADITNQRDIVDVVMQTKPAAIAHLAALHLIPVCEIEPRRTLEVNIGGLLNVLEAADRSETRFVLFASSADVYAPSTAPLAESDPARPSSVYGASKLLGERLVAEWAGGRPGRRATNVRIFNVYGPGDTNPHVIPDILSRLGADSEIRVGNVETKRDFIHVDDLVEVLCRMLESTDPPALLNAGTGRATAVSEVLGIIQRLVEHRFTWISDSGQARANDRFCLQADTSHLRSLFPEFDPRDIETGLREIVTATGTNIGELRDARAGRA